MSSPILASVMWGCVLEVVLLVQRDDDRDEWVVNIK